MEGPRILHIDIETAPILAWVWGLFKQNVAIGQIHKDWHILCWAAKWHKEAGVYSDALWRHTVSGKWTKGAEEKIVRSVWRMLDEADIVVGHNADRFDVSKINAKFYEYGMLPPSPYRTVDTLKVARNRFGFPSNKLDYIIQLKAKGAKLKTDFELWIDVMTGKPKACKRMMDYNMEDVRILEDVYTDMLPWITNHPNMGVYNDGEATQCSACGSTHIHKRGFSYTNLGVYQRIVCIGCGHWDKLPTNLLSPEKRKQLARAVPK